MSAGSPDLLLVRAADLVVLGVAFSDGFQAGPSGGVPTLEATRSGAQLTIVFAPQSIAEEKYQGPGDGSLRRARLAGASRVTFDVTAGTTIELNVAGLLGALTSAALTEDDANPTVIELPWHLPVRPAAGTGVRMVCEHLADAAPSTAGVTGLWTTRLRAQNATTGDAGLVLIPLDPNQDDGGLDVSPLNGGQRQSIKDALPARASARRLELSALGGSLSARLATPGFDWDHDATLGRDRRVRVAEAGVLYPFGHRAVYVEIAERVFDPGGAPTLAAMHRDTYLFLSEPVRNMSSDEIAVLRTFPFSEVEVLGDSFTGIARAAFTQITRPVDPPTDLQDQLDTVQADQAQKAADVQQFLADQPQTLEQYIEQGLGSAPDLTQARQDAASFDPAGLLQQQRDIDAEIDSLEGQLASETDPDAAQVIQQQISDLIATRPTNQDIAAAQAGLNAANAQIAALTPVVQQEFDSLPRTVEAAAAVFLPAQQLLDDNTQIANLNGEIAAIDAAASEQHDLLFVPTLENGQPLQFPIRCAGALGDVTFSVPLVFVKDFTLPAQDHVPEFRSLTDATAVNLVTGAWQANSTIPLPGTRIDMVRGGEPQPPPGDVHEVHSLTVAGIASPDGFRPRLTSFAVQLPALRALLPEQAATVTLRYADEFLEQPAIPEIPFEIAPSETINVLFTGRADRSGGLVTPNFLADSISRTLGPVARQSVPGLPSFNFQSAFKDATLLGFPLSSLVDLASGTPDPQPPAILAPLADGIPDGVQMDWTLDLAQHGPFRPTAQTKLVLSARLSPADGQSKTVCTVNDFGLVLPPDGVIASGLLTLDFSSVQFTQIAGKPPSLAIKGLHVGFGGALKLLQEIEAEVDKFVSLPENVPTVDVRADGIAASYGLAVPSIPAGAFLIRDISMRVELDVPFDGKPVTVELSFASRDDPFNVSVLAFGGGGYIDLTIGPEGLQRLEASIDFGASLVVDFIIARGEVHALGGVRFVQDAESIDIDGFIRIGGSVEVLGLVSVSIELVVTLSYQEGPDPSDPTAPPRNRLVGRATIVIDVDLLLYSDSVEIDSGEWVLAGSEGQPRMHSLAIAAVSDPFVAWQQYLGAFADEGSG